MKRKELSDEAKDAQVRLKMAWAKASAERGKKDLNQKEFGKANDWTQSTVTQYLNGHIPLNIPALKAFCKELQVDPHDIYPELAEQMSLEVNIIDPKLADDINSLAPRVRDMVTGLVRELAKK